MVVIGGGRVAECHPGSWGKGRGKGRPADAGRADGPEQVARARCAPCARARRPPSSIDTQVGGVVVYARGWPAGTFRSAKFK